MTAPVPQHVPVLRDEAVSGLNPQSDGCYVDGTFGDGGYSRAILDSAPCRVIAVDRDPDAVRRGSTLVGHYRGRLTLVEGRFGDMPALVATVGVDQVDGIVMDLGVSTRQLLDPARGLSFRLDGELDMRLGRDGPTAAEVVNHEPEPALADIIWRYGEERHSRRIARAIVAARSHAPIRTTVRLAEIVRDAVPRSGKPPTIDPATRTFQALRIHVNDELDELERALHAAEHLLVAGGRLVVVSFHSLEDRSVKRFLRRRDGTGTGRSRHAPPDPVDPPLPSFRTLNQRPIRPGPAERAINPASRSARLRVAARTAAAPWPETLS